MKDTCGDCVAAREEPNRAYSTLIQQAHANCYKRAYYVLWKIPNMREILRQRSPTGTNYLLLSYAM